MSGGRGSKWSTRAVTGAIFAGLASSIVGCDFNFCDSKLIEKTSSPANQYSFFIIKKDCGATTSSAYSIYISDRDEIPKNDDPLFVADRLDGLSVTWIDDSAVLIKYTKARIFSFKNFWTQQVGDEHVEVSLVLKAR